MGETMLAVQITIMAMASDAKGWFADRIDVRDDRGSIPAQTILIMMLAVAAVAAGTLLATKITQNAERTPVAP